MAGTEPHARGRAEWTTSRMSGRMCNLPPSQQRVSANGATSVFEENAELGFLDILGESLAGCAGLLAASRMKL